MEDKVYTLGNVIRTYQINFGKTSKDIDFNTRTFN